MMTSKPGFSEKFIGIAMLALAGPLIWVLHFAVVYGVQHFACVTLKDSADFLVRASVTAATAAALLVLLVVILKADVLQRLDRNSMRPASIKVFFSGIMRLLAFLSFFAVLWSGIALFFLPACGSVA